MKKNFFSLVAISAFLFSGTLLFSATPTSVSDKSDYRNFCSKAASDSTVFQSFKSSPIYRVVLEHVSQYQGAQYLDYIVNHYPSLLNSWKKFVSNDQVGQPITYSYPPFGQVSPTTWRYVKILGDLQSFFGALDGKTIVEIGGGYGGQCKIIHDLASVKSYTIIDLPEPLALTSKYLSVMNVPNVTLVPPSKTQAQKSDIVISNFTFSDCNKDVQTDYLNKYILNSASGYMILNNYKGRLSPVPYSAEEIKQILNVNGYTAVLYPEDPQTAGSNVLLIWTKKI